MENKITITKEEFTKATANALKEMTLNATKENDGMGSLMIILLGVKIINEMEKYLFGEESDEVTKDEEVTKDDDI